MDKKITATELARTLSDVLNRVRYRGESFVVERNGEAIAELGPVAHRPHMTVADLYQLLNTLDWPDEDFANDLEEIQANQRLVEFREWPS